MTQGELALRALRLMIFAAVGCSPTMPPLPAVEQAMSGTPPVTRGAEQPSGPPPGATVLGTAEPQDEDPLDGVEPIALGPRQVRVLVAALPLSSESIDFDRIDRFFLLYASIAAGAPGSRRGGLGQSIQLARRAMKEVGRRTTIEGRSTFPMHDLTPSVVQGWLKAPQGMHFSTVLEALKVVIESARTIVADFYGECSRSKSNADGCSFNEEQANAVQRQVVGSSIARANWDALQRVANRLGEVRQGARE